MGGVLSIIPFVEKFDNIVKVKVHDFWPLLRSRQLLSPQMFGDDRKTLLSYADNNPGKFEVITRDNDLEVLARA